MENNSKVLINPSVFRYLQSCHSTATNIVNDLLSVRLPDSINSDTSDVISSYIDSMNFFRAVLRDLSTALSQYPSDYGVDRSPDFKDFDVPSELLNVDEKISDDDMRLVSQ